MPAIFLCHSSRDKPAVRRLAGYLADHGVRVWLDEAELNIGDSLCGRIGAALSEVDKVGVVLTGQAIKSVWVQRELQIALARELRERQNIIMPLLFESVEVPPFLSDKVYGDFTTEDAWIRSMPLLLRALGVEVQTASHQSEDRPSRHNANAILSTLVAIADPLRVRRAVSDVNRWLNRSLIVPQELMHHVHRCCLVGYPDIMSCGALLGIDNKYARVVYEARPVINVEMRNPRTMFAMNPTDVLAIENERWRSGRTVLGYYASHIDQPAMPSLYDLDMAWPWYSYLKISLRADRVADSASFFLSHDRSTFVREPIQLV